MTIWVVIEHFKGEPRRVSLELATLGNRFQEQGNLVTAFAFGEGSEKIINSLQSYGIKDFVSCPDSCFDRHGATAWAMQLNYLAQQQPPSLILVSATYFGRELAGLLTVWLDGSLLSNVTDIWSEDGKWFAIEKPLAGTWKTKVVANKEPIIATWKPQSLTPELKEVTVSDVNLKTVQPQLDKSMVVPEITERQKVERAQKVNLTEADIIVSGGRGVGSPEGFNPLKELCEVLGAALGSSRAAVDSGWIPYEHQVGQTGKTVKPRVYIACGISGAIQHRAGMQSSDIIIAINKDPNAPIFQICDLGVIGDLFEIIPKLAEEIQRRKP